MMDLMGDSCVMVIRSEYVDLFRVPLEMLDDLARLNGGVLQTVYIKAQVDIESKEERPPRRYAITVTPL